MLGFLNKFFKFFGYNVWCIWFIQLPSITVPKVPFFSNLFSIFSFQNLRLFPSFEFSYLDSKGIVSRAIIRLSMVKCPWVPFVFHHWSHIRFLSFQFSFFIKESSCRVFQWLPDMFSPFKIYSDCWDCVLDVSIYFQIKNSSKHSSFFLSFSKSDIFIHLSNKTNLEFTWSISTVLFILVFLQIYFSSSITLTRSLNKFIC